MLDYGGDVVPKTMGVGQLIVDAKMVFDNDNCLNLMIGNEKRGTENKNYL